MKIRQHARGFAFAMALCELVSFSSYAYLFKKTSNNTEALLLQNLDKLKKAY